MSEKIFFSGKYHFFLREQELCFLFVSGGFSQTGPLSVRHVTRGTLHVGQVFSRHFCPLYPPTGTLSEKASACLSTPNLAVPFRAKVTTTVPNCLEGSCDAGRPTVSRSWRGLMHRWCDTSSAVNREQFSFTVSDICLKSHLSLLGFYNPVSSKLNYTNYKLHFFMTKLFK